AVVEDERPVAVRELGQLEHPRRRVGGEPHDQQERIAAAVLLVVHLDVAHARRAHPKASPPCSGSVRRRAREYGRAPFRRSIRKILHCQCGPHGRKRRAVTPAARRAIIALLAVAGPVRATTVLPVPLARVAGEAARIVHATVLDVRSGRDADGLPATWITLDVARTLKGAATSRLIFKQYGVADPLPDGTVARVPGLPRYAAGEEIVLFLRGESRRGFTSPVGFGQGVYRVARRGGRPSVGDGVRGHPRRDLDAFLDDVGRLVGP